MLQTMIAVFGVFLCAWQPGLSQALSIRGIEPDLGIVFISSVGLLMGPVAGAIAGFSYGLLQVSQSGIHGVGSFLFARVCVGYGAGHAGAGVFPGNLVVPGISAVGASLTAEIIRFLLCPYPDLGTWTRMALGTAFYSGLVALPIHRVLAYLVRRFGAEPAGGL